MTYTTELIPNLNKLIAAKNAIVAKLKAVGVAVPDGATLEQLSALIPSGGGGADAAVTVTAATLFNGETARDKDGNLIIGTALSATTSAGLYDVGKGKTFYNHYGELCTGLGDFTPAEDVAAMQQQIDGFKQKLMQITADADAVLQGYTAMGADGELFTGQGRKSELVTVEGTWTKKITTSQVSLSFPFTETDGYIYIIAAQETHWNQSTQSITNRFVYIFKDGEILNKYLHTYSSNTNISASLNTSTGLFTATISGEGTYRTNAAPAVTHLFAYVIK